ncbi:short-chain dehydrogenase [Pseudoclavibacter sp. AY1F1]|uniref:SDR family oxidoreductase n=1 Tax=Pseudoclavibacter sp. AY1F1 TaxID=2080583 RepID=UPI000CE74327|nr:SDR family oxidoreductase [Pseudoclavibacter sp. AY1F1]PPF42700.1 short-chain dehydrogenase [Pseudoclavibacter sp. AY1F1]
MPATPLRPVGRVLITGGASGLGAAVAEAVAEAGGTPIVLDLDTSGVASGALARDVDVTDRPAVERAVVEVAEELGGLDAVVTAAGIDRPAKLEELSGEEWEKIVAVNLFGTVSTVRAALPYLEASHGRVVTVASSLALRPLSDATAYSASKFAVLGFSRALAAETRGRLGVTTLIPAGMRTKFFDGRTEQYKPGPDAQLNDPADVARSVVFVVQQPQGVEVRELAIFPEEEPSWP